MGALLSGRANAFGLLRLVLATSVVYAHVYPLGYNSEDPLWGISGHQTDVGKMAVVGFFVLSGFMITSSGRRLGIGRYSWHRALRILPGLWVCVLVTALVVGPLLFMHLHGTTSGYWHHHPDGPFAYIKGMATTAIASGYDISGVMRTGVQRGLLHNAAFDGALWSLKYELLCYVIVGIFAAGGALKRAPRTVLLATLGLYASMWANTWHASTLRGPSNEPAVYLRVPILGQASSHYIIYLTFAFLLGGCFQLFRDKIPVNDVLGVLSALVVLATFRWGMFTVVGYPAFAYLLIWLGLRLPKQVHWVGRKNDYSYGIYIYGFVVEQVLCMYGASHWGAPRYFGVSLALTAAVAFLSWHLVEKQAMRLKDWSPNRPGWTPGRSRRRAEARNGTRDETQGGLPAADPPSNVAVGQGA
ncbi:acyltransferase family protein [Streptacidiphilus sp. N1-3]|uniref:Acyltransferase family protein n=1 Tax=Streptacidiphilus alkalitolerans TaxID=3342712 RepID=A0ABV6X419_9ACTN